MLKFPFAFNSVLHVWAFLQVCYHTASLMKKPMKWRCKNSLGQDRVCQVSTFSGTENAQELSSCQPDLPAPHHTSARWHSLSPGSLHSSTTSLQVVSGVTGTSVKCCSLLLRYTVRNICKRQRQQHMVTLQHKGRLHLGATTCSLNAFFPTQITSYQQQWVWFSKQPQISLRYKQERHCRSNPLLN